MRATSPPETMRSLPGTFAATGQRTSLAVGVPAWLLSVLLHLGVMLALALILATSPSRSSLPEPDRGVGIVLRSGDIDRPVEYFDPTSQAANQTPVTTERPSAIGSPTADTNDLASALPPADALTELRIDDIRLPATALIGAAGPTDDSALDFARAGTWRGSADFSDSAYEEAILAEEAQRHRQTGPTGPVAHVSLFGGEAAVGRSFVFAIDRSKSMQEQGAIAAAERELIAALDRLEDSLRFQIIAYHHKPTYFDPAAMSRATREQKDKVPEFFDTLAAFGGTDHEMALLAALRFSPDVVFLLTDGGDPELGESQIDRIVGRAGRRTVIHCIRFGSGPLRESDDFLRRLALAGGGSYGYVDMSKP